MRKPQTPQVYVSTGASPRRWRRRVLLGLLVVVGLAIIAGVAMLVHLQQLGLHPFQQAASLLGPPFGGKQRVHILVLGVDSDREPRRSDTMFVTTIDVRAKRASILSIPRDLRVEIPGHGTQKVNAAYALGGVDLARRTADEVIGIETDYYVKITVPGLVRLVDGLGGVWIDVDKRMRYRDRSQRLFINLQPGLQLLTGEQAMHYVRFRMDALGDLTRIQRQQNFLKAVAQQAVTGRNLVRLPRLINLFVKAVETNLMVGDLRGLADLAKEVDANSIRCATLPAEPVMVGGISYLEPDWPAVDRMVGDVLLGKPPIVEVVNESGDANSAVAAAGRLEGEGCEVAHITEGERLSSATRLIDHFGRPDRAKELAEAVKATSVQVAKDGGELDFTVVVGADFSASTRQAHPGS